MGTRVVDLGKINLDYDNNFYGDDPETFIYVSSWHTEFEKHKAFWKNISTELILVA